ncbi:ABC transporter G family member [Melia azedarach]|uniref:ABC transporter G family member n=1 Tax=Melia azedarach TaxID=155640 RepID=A0ACC1X0B1_MELAZ|nr:ABC transporter G family member [Melia azedarach]
MANPNLSPATAIADDNLLLFNPTQKPEIQKVSSVIDLSDECTAWATSYPFTLSFNNLTYSVKIPKSLALPFRWNIGNLCSQGNGNTKVLLDDVSGEARQGEIMAIMGASGAGKTTLIDALAGRIEKECLKGTVTLNGEVLESKLLNNISAYVMQEDILYPLLTVEETLMFSAEFRLPRSLSQD